MKLYSTNAINALGNRGPEETPKHFPQAELIQVNNDNIQESQAILYNKAKQIFNNENQVEQISLTGDSRSPKKLKVFLGGDHSITFPIFKAFQETNKDPFLIIFDAHADCMPPQQEPTHEEFLRAIIEKGFNPQNIILIGTRKIEPQEKNFLYQHNIKIFNEIYDLEAAADFITEKANQHDTYLSIDIDALDPAFAPAVNYPEPNGLSPKEFFYLLKRILKVKTLKAIDIVEAVPEKDKQFDNRTINTIKKIIELSTNS